MTDIPYQCGFYRIRLVHGGVFVPARVEFGIAKDPLTGETLDRSPLWTVTVGDKVRSCPDQITAFAIWPTGRGERIDEAEYEHMRALAEHARRHEPDMPQANPSAPVDWSRTTFQFSRRKATT